MNGKATLAYALSVDLVSLFASTIKYRPLRRRRNGESPEIRNIVTAVLDLATCGHAALAVEHDHHRACPGDYALHLLDANPIAVHKIGLARPPLAAGFPAVGRANKLDEHLGVIRNGEPECAHLQLARHMPVPHSRYPRCISTHPLALCSYSVHQQA